MWPHGIQRLLAGEGEPMVEGCQCDFSCSFVTGLIEVKVMLEVNSPHKTVPDRTNHSVNASFRVMKCEQQIEWRRAVRDHSFSKHPIGVLGGHRRRYAGNQ